MTGSHRIACNSASGSITARDLRDEVRLTPVQDARILAYELGSRCERDEMPPPNLSELETIKTKVKRGRRARGDRSCNRARTSRDKAAPELASRAARNMADCRAPKEHRTGISCPPDAFRFFS